MQRRRAEYPDIGDQLGALWEALADAPLPPKAEAIRAEIQAVKARYPKVAE